MSKSESKPYEDESLRGILKAKDEGLFAVLERNWSRAKSSVLEHLSEYGFPTHGPSHCERVELKLEQLMPLEVKQEMSTIEIFILLHSVFYHDLGMADRNYPDEPIEDRRARHHEASAAYIRSHYKELGLDQNIAFRVADVSRAHCLSSLDLDLEPDYIDEYKGGIRVAILAALLRLGDIMDWAASRAPLQVAEMTWVAGDSYRHWLEHNLIESIRPEPQRNRIVITGIPRGDWGVRQLEDIRGWMQRELELVQPILETAGLNYSTFILRTKKYLYAGHAPDRAGRNPFQLLLSYDETTRDLFFGREPELDEILCNLFSYDKTIVLGESGVGKTSFLRAGLIPVLQELDFCIVYMDDYHGGLGELKTRICSASGVQPNESPSLGDLLKRAAAGKKRLVLVLDQFEKNLTTKHPTLAFLDDIAQLCRKGEIGARLVFSMRDDLTTGLWQWSKNERLELLKDAHLAWIMRMDVRRAKEVMTRTLEKAGAGGEDGLFDEIAEDLLIAGGRDTVFLPDLQVVCSRLWDSAHRSKKRPITLTKKQYRRLGPATRIISDFFEKTMWQGFTKKEVPIVHKILNGLVTLDGFRRRRTLKDLADLVQAKESRLLSLLAQLIDKRLARRYESLSGELSEASFELVHDCLAKRLSEGLTSEEKEDMAAGELLSSARQDWKRHGLLIDADRLRIIEGHAGAIVFEPEDTSLIVLSTLKPAAQPMMYDLYYFRHARRRGILPPRLSDAWWPPLGNELVDLLVGYALDPKQLTDKLLDLTRQTILSRRFSLEELYRYRSYMDDYFGSWARDTLKAAPQSLTQRICTIVMGNVEHPAIGQLFGTLGNIDTGVLIKVATSVLERGGTISKELYLSLCQSGQEGIKFILGIQKLDSNVVVESLISIVSGELKIPKSTYRLFRELLIRFQPKIDKYVINALNKSLESYIRQYHPERALMLVRLCGDLKIRKASRSLRKASSLMRVASARIAVTRAMGRIDPNLFKKELSKLARSRSHGVRNAATKALAQKSN